MHNNEKAHVQTVALFMRLKPRDNKELLPFVFFSIL